MDHLRSGIGLRGYAQIDPRIEYKRGALGMYESMNLSIRDEVTDLIFKLQLGKEAERRDVWHPDHYVHQEVSGLKTMQESSVPASVPQDAAADSEERAGRKIEPLKVSIKTGRNQPCPCGSGKKFKQCCGRVN